MTLQEIKKEYQKMSRQLKKQNLNYTCVMNAKQQRLGTATICFFSSMDHEARIKRAEAQLADTADTMKEAKKSAQYWGKKINTLRSWAADEKCSTRQTWIDIVEAYDNGTLVDKEYRREEDQKHSCLKSCKEDFEKNGTLEEQHKRGMKRLEELKTANPVKTFCKNTGATMQLEYKEDGNMTLWYLRFFYKEN